MKNLIIIACVLVGNAASAQSSQADKKSMERVKSSVVYLSSDKLEGRRTGTAGEKLAYEFISDQFKKAGLKPMGSNGSFIQPFDVKGAEKRTGHNVVGFIDNKAAHTVVLGAHYDHLGYGEDKNSMYRGDSAMVHNGADDNASGTSALIELGYWLKKSKLRNYNYLLVAFSGEELGLFGSKYFADNSPVPASNINYMINMDMVGRLNDSTHGLSVGGFGTSPAWSQLIDKNDKQFSIKIDSSGTGPSDHTSFYLKNIPVLFFFTGTHKDYHKPGDDADKINYNGMLQIIGYIQNILTATDAQDKVAFTKTREVHSGMRSSFKVTLGVMLDYTFSGPGIYVDAVTEDRPAAKAGVEAKDIILQLGEHPLADVEAYMKALSKFEKGQTTNMKVKRGEKELMLPVTF
ncbi:MAG: M28 family peptidase [Chitinophagaceae bacterium]|nr:MAG: M28 family peptidase [Chitinophagaceae bacterium]